MSNNKMSNSKMSNSKAPSSNTNQSLKNTHSSNSFIIIGGVLCLLFVIIYLYNKYQTVKALTTNVTKPYPMCPDYWDSIGNNQCQNTNNIGSCSNRPGSNIVDFGTDIFTNKNIGDYTKCKWANSCNVSWGNINKLC
jgi:hypothetical protein